MSGAVTTPIPFVVHMAHPADGPAGEDDAGAALLGILGALAYNARIERTVVAGLFAAADAPRLADPAHGVTLRYSSHHGVYNGVTSERQAALAAVERRYGVKLLYGAQRFGNAVHELLLVDASHAHRSEVDPFHYFLWKEHNLDCRRYSHRGDFLLAVAAAPALLAGLAAIDAGAGLRASQKVIVAHDWAGLPLVLAAQMNEPGQWNSVYYAHAAPTAQRLIETRSGHDTAFYNVLFQSKRWQLDIDSLYGSQDDQVEHRLMRLASRCDNVLAVSELTVDELRFMGGRLGRSNISLAPYGLPAPAVTLEERQTARQLLRDCAAALTGAAPDFVFTHQAPLALRRAFWRDMRVLEHLDELLRRRGERAVLLVHASSRPDARPPEWIAAWEAAYGWPLTHRGDNGDLVGDEVEYYANVLEPFNRRAANIRAVLVNQPGETPGQGATRMPAGLTAATFRHGADVVFGQSIYEPFGRSQAAALANGALASVSNVCGCVSFIDNTLGGSEHLANLVVADYMSLPQGYWLGSPYDALAIDRGVRDWVEANASRPAAQALDERLPRTEDAVAHLLEAGAAAAARMSWEVVVRDYFLPALKYATRKGE